MSDKFSCKIFLIMTSRKKTPPKKKSRKILKLADKLKILDLIANRETIAAVARRFNVNQSTIRTIRSNKQKIHRRALKFGHQCQAFKTAKVKMKNIILKKKQSCLVSKHDLRIVKIYFLQKKFV